MWVEVHGKRSKQGRLMICRSEHIRQKSASLTQSKDALRYDTRGARQCGPPNDHTMHVNGKDGGFVCNNQILSSTHAAWARCFEVHGRIDDQSARPRTPGPACIRIGAGVHTFGQAPGLGCKRPNRQSVFVEHGNDAVVLRAGDADHRVRRHRQLHELPAPAVGLPHDHLPHAALARCQLACDQNRVRQHRALQRPCVLAVVPQAGAGLHRRTRGVVLRVCRPPRHNLGVAVDGDDERRAHRHRRPPYLSQALLQHHACVEPRRLLDVRQPQGALPLAAHERAAAGRHHLAPRRVADLPPVRLDGGKLVVPRVDAADHAAAAYEQQVCVDGHAFDLQPAVGARHALGERVVRHLLAVLGQREDPQVRCPVGRADTERRAEAGKGHRQRRLAHVRLARFGTPPRLDQPGVSPWLRQRHGPHVLPAAGAARTEAAGDAATAARASARHRLELERQLHGRGRDDERCGGHRAACAPGGKRGVLRRGERLDVSLVAGVLLRFACAAGGVVVGAAGFGNVEAVEAGNGGAFSHSLSRRQLLAQLSPL
eukprot:Rhum_TRINITY_DN14632_c5_g1::Rhum_TRINITY_DN14632_c5_g1_i1::g.106382::m.106382